MKANVFCENHEGCPNLLSPALVLLVFEFLIELGDALLQLRDGISSSA
jgi:hypothetical protein